MQYLYSLIHFDIYSHLNQMAAFASVSTRLYYDNAPLTTNTSDLTFNYCLQCAGQKNRVKHGKSGNFTEEGWSGKCGINEVTCHISGYGDGGLLSYDWKHFPYEVSAGINCISSQTMR